MSDRETFERAVADWLATRGAEPRSASLHDRIIDIAGHTRQRPTALALMKEPPMRISNTIAVGSAPVRAAAILVTTLLLAAALIGTGIAGRSLLAASTIVVDPAGSGTVETITEAVTMAVDGDTILVRPGTYDESLTVTEDITIRGDGDRERIVIKLSATIRERANHTLPNLPFALHLIGSDAVVENLTFRDEAARIIIDGGAPILRNVHLDGIGRVYGLDAGGSSVPHGLTIIGGATGEVSDSLLTDSDVVIYDGASPTIARNRMLGVGIEGPGTNPRIIGNVMKQLGRFDAITAWSGSQPEIIGNTIEAEGTGIGLRFTAFLDDESGVPNPRIADNTFIGTRVGVSVTSRTTAEIEANRFEGAGAAIVLSTAEATVRDNEIVGGNTGIAIVGPISPVLEGNRIEGTAFAGVSIAPEGTPTLNGNRFCGNTAHVVLKAGASLQLDGNEVCEGDPTPLISE